MIIQDRDLINNLHKLKIQKASFHVSGPGHEVIKLFHNSAEYKLYPAYRC